MAHPRGGQNHAYTSLSYHRSAVAIREVVRHTQRERESSLN